MKPLEVSQTVMDAYAARILLGTSQSAVSALELSRRFGIPIAACYRRIRQLEDLGLVYCERALPSRNGKGLQLFRSRVRSIRIAFEEGQIRARVEVLPTAGSLDASPLVDEQVVNLADPRRAA